MTSLVLNNRALISYQHSCVNAFFHTELVCWLVNKVPQSSISFEHDEKQVNYGLKTIPNIYQGP